VRSACVCSVHVCSSVCVCVCACSVCSVECYTCQFCDIIAIVCDNVAGFGALMAADRDQQLQRQKNHHTQSSSTHNKHNTQKHQQTVNGHRIENTNHNNSSPVVKPKQSSKSPKTTKRKVLVIHLFIML